MNPDELKSVLADLAANATDKFFVGFSRGLKSSYFAYSREHFYYDMMFWVNLCWRHDSHCDYDRCICMYLPVFFFTPYCFHRPLKCYLLKLDLIKYVYQFVFNSMYKVRVVIWVEGSRYVCRELFPYVSSSNYNGFR